MDYERGEASPSTGILYRIVKALEASPDVLMNGTLQDKSASSDKRKSFKELLEGLFLKLICKKY